MHKLYLPIGVLVIVALVVTAFTASNIAAKTTAVPISLAFEIGLSGSQEIPEVTTTTSGTATLTFATDLSGMHFAVTVLDGIKLVQGHLHCAKAGVNGPIFAFLFGPVAGGIDVDGGTATGTLTNDEILTPVACGGPGLDIINIASLASAMKEGRVYVNVHSIANPSGEIRGQILGD